MLNMEQKINISKKYIIKIVMLFLNIMCLIVGIWGIHGLWIDGKVVRRDEGFIFFSLQHESSPFSVDIQNFRQLQKELLDTEWYEYYEIYGQPLFLEENIFQDKENDWKTDDGKHIINAVQIGQNVCDDFGIEIYKGREFIKSDFLYKSKEKLPILIGYEWVNKLSIGDIVCVEYLYDTYECVVIGVLAPESMIYMTNKTYLLDNCIVMPSFEVLQGSNITDGLKIHYANKVSGIIKAEKGKERQAIKYLNSCIKNTSTGKYSWYSTLIDINLRHTFHVGIYEILFMDIVVCFLINVFMRRKIRRNK